MGKTCETCAFWAPHQERRSPEGWCKRYPPAFKPTAADRAFICYPREAFAYPTTAAFDFCGEHQPQPKEETR